MENDILGPGIRAAGLFQEQQKQTCVVPVEIDIETKLAVDRGELPIGVLYRDRQRAGIKGAQPVG